MDKESITDRKYKNLGNPFCEQTKTIDNTNDGNTSSVNTIESTITIKYIK